MTALLALLLVAGPKDCKEDFACFEAAAKKCEPVTYVSRSTQSFMGVSGLGALTYTIVASVNGSCALNRDVSVESVQVSPETARLILPDAGPSETAALEKQLLAQVDKDPASHYRCVIAAGELAAWVKIEQPKKNQIKSLPSDHFANCTPAECGPQPKLADGCAYTQCSGDGWLFKCGKDECRVLMPERYDDSTRLTCLADLNGNVAIDVKQAPKKKK